MKNYKELFESMTAEELLAFIESLEIEVEGEELEEKGDVPLRSNGPTIKDTGIPRDKGAKPLRDNEVPTKKGQDPVDPKKGDMPEFMPERDAREAELKKSKYMVEDSEAYDLDDEIDLCEEAEAYLDKLFEDVLLEEECEEKVNIKKSPEEEEIDVDEKELEEMAAIDADLDELEAFLESYSFEDIED